MNRTISSILTPLAIVLILITAGASIYSGSQYFQLKHETNISRSLPKDDATWGIMQLNTEELKFSNVLHSVMINNTPETRKNLSLRLDILYSRIDVVHQVFDRLFQWASNNKGSKIYPVTQDILQQINSEFDGIKELFTEIDQEVQIFLKVPDIGNLTEIQSKMDLLISMSSELASQVNQASNQTAFNVRENVFEQTQHFQLALLVITFSFISFSIIAYALYVKAHRAERRSTQAAEELRIASEAKTSFLSSMSHELRTPLNAIIGFGQLLDNDPNHQLTKDQHAATHQILQGGTHLLELINQVLDLAKIESGNLALSIEAVDTNAILKDCLTIASSMAKKKAITVHLEMSDKEKIPFIRADHTRFRQILLNLLSNAIKYNDEGGTITLTCRTMDTGMFRVSIADTGQGIPDEHQRQVFMPFNRLAKEGSKTEGTGIGLSITRQIIELMKGEIGFTSVEGEGSNFWFELPLAKEVDRDSLVKEVTEEIQNGELGQMEIPPCTILYVEDNPANLQLMEMILGRVGSLNLHTAHTAEIGIEITEQVQPDLILMDINLPGMNGIEALKVLRNRPETQKIPVIAISANAMPHDLTLAKKAGFEAYITKPFNIPDVIATISRELGQAAETKKTGQQTNKTIEHSTEYAPLAEDDINRLFSAAAALPLEYLSILKHQAATIPVLLAKFRSAAHKRENTEAENLAHTLKTNSGTFGARDLWSQAQNAEEMARQGDIPNTLVIGMEENYEVVAPIIERLLDDLQTHSGHN